MRSSRDLGSAEDSVVFFWKSFSRCNRSNVSEPSENLDSAFLIPTTEISSLAYRTRGSNVCFNRFSTTRKKNIHSPDYEYTRYRLFFRKANHPDFSNNRTDSEASRVFCSGQKKWLNVEEDFNEGRRHLIISTFAAFLRGTFPSSCFIPSRVAVCVAPSTGDSEPAR